MKGTNLYRVSIFLAGEREELYKIEAAFTWLKMNLGINKIELYKKALLWIASDEKAKQKFIEYLMNEKAKAQIMEIAE
jgi:hypothetical protein